MRALRPMAVAALMATIGNLGCGGGDPPVQPNPPVLTTVKVTPDTATLFTIPPGTSVKLSAAGLDQDGAVMSGLGTVDYASGSHAIAAVDEDGIVTQVSPGTAVITATITSGDITRSGSATLTVKVPPPGAAVQTPSLRFEPEVVDIAAGGSVGWTIGETTHDVVFITQNAPENIQPTRQVTVTRTFPTAGEFNYHCLLHPRMTGTVRVH